MRGRLSIVGLGPGDASLQTPRAAEILAQATDVLGYGPYVARVPERPGLTRHVIDNRQELERARHALQLAAAGGDVAVVSSGDPGVFAMASAVFEAIEAGEPEWRELDVEVVPGVSAMFAAAARLGAPLGHDFCAISLLAIGRSRRLGRSAGARSCAPPRAAGRSSPPRLASSHRRRQARARRDSGSG